MSSLWTPDGERPVGRQPAPPAPPSQMTPPPPAAGPASEAAREPTEPTDEQLQAEMEELRERLAATPVEVVVANHCFGLFELAALHLSLQPPNLREAQLAIDALAGLVEALPGRIGDAEAQLLEALTQLRLAFVQIRAAGGVAPA